MAVYSITEPSCEDMFGRFKRRRLSTVVFCIFWIAVVYYITSELGKVLFPPHSSLSKSASVQRVRTREKMMEPSEKVAEEAGDTSKPLCPFPPPGLRDNISDLTKLNFESVDEVERLILPKLTTALPHQPARCTARQSVAVIVPYRKRDEQLPVFLYHMHNLLTNQLLCYGIFIVEPQEQDTFNRAKLLNIGFAEALKLYKWDCFVFHDVDLLPQSERNYYMCDDNPKSLAPSIDKAGANKIMYSTFMGAASAVKREAVQRANGHSNDYWGWGMEDDDFSVRLQLCNYQITRTPVQYGRQLMLEHTASRKEPGNLENACGTKLHRLVRERWKRDGLNSLNYTLLRTTVRLTHVHLLVDLNEKESQAKLDAEKIC